MRAHPCTCSPVPAHAHTPPYLQPLACLHMHTHPHTCRPVPAHAHTHPHLQPLPCTPAQLPPGTPPPEPGFRLWGVQDPPPRT
eukprot:1076321-Prorocentrum_minimum.AAC.1